MGENQNVTIHDCFCQRGETISWSGPWPTGSKRQQRAGSRSLCQTLQLGYPSKGVGRDPTTLQAGAGSIIESWWNTKGLGPAYLC